MTPPVAHRDSRVDGPRPRPATIPLPWPWRPVVVGGPWRDAPEEGRAVRRICLAREESEHTRTFPDILINCTDFGTPKEVAMLGGLAQAVIDMVNGRSIYVGCGAGRGRTGLFLALLLKVCGVADPVEFLRRTYLREAVETREQEQYIKDFPVEDIQRLLRRGIWKRRLTFGLLKV